MSLKYKNSCVSIWSEEYETSLNSFTTFSLSDLNILNVVNYPNIVAFESDTKVYVSAVFYFIMEIRLLLFDFMEKFYGT